MTSDLRVDSAGIFRTVRPQRIPEGFAPAHYSPLANTRVFFKTYTSRLPPKLSVWLGTSVLWMFATLRRSHRRYLNGHQSG